MGNLIINADDLGLNANCTAAIVKAFEQGLITDTTMVANGEAFEEAVSAALGALKGRVGIHLNLTEGRPLTTGILQFEDFCSDGKFNKGFSRIKPLDGPRKKAVYEELSAQVWQLVEAGIEITHADSHHHIHTALCIAPIMAKVCKENGIKKVRLHRNIGEISAFKMLIKKIYNAWLRRNFAATDFFGSAADLAHGLPKGITELMVHPVFGPNGELLDKEKATKPLDSIRSIIGQAHLTCYREIKK